MKIFRMCISFSRMNFDSSAMVNDESFLHS